MEKKVSNRKYQSQKKTIMRQMEEIEKLRQEVENLQIDCNKRDELIDSINSIRDEFYEVIDDIKAKGEEYDALISDLKQMRQVMNHTYFKGKWKLIKLLLK